jgi:hypothetical protein
MFELLTNRAASLLPCRGEAQLISIACSQAQAGHDHWTVWLLAGKLVELGIVESISLETVRLTLKKTN